MRSVRPPSKSPGLIAMAATVALVMVLASCSPDQTSDSDSSTTTGSTVSTSSTTVSSTSTSSTTTGPLRQYSVSELLDLQAKQEVIVVGMVFAVRGSTVLCEGLAESFPPQCAGRWIVVTNPDAIGAELTTGEDVSWSDKPVALAGRLTDGRFLLSGAPSGVEVTDADRAVIEAFIEFARTDGDPADLPIAPGGLQLGLADRIFLTRSLEELSDRSSWDIAFEPFRGRVAPFSAYELLADPRETNVVVGGHDHCAAPPWPIPEGFEQHRHVSIQPIRASSCIEWFTVDFFVNDVGLVEAITLDLWEP